MEIALGDQRFVELPDQTFDFGVGRRLLDRLGGRHREVRSPRPFIGQQDHRLGEVQGRERGIDRDGHDRFRERDLLSLEARALRPEEDRRSCRRGRDLASHRLRGEDRHDKVAATDGRRIDGRAVGDRILDRVEHLRLFEHAVRAARRWSGVRIGPAVARRHEP